MKWPDPSSLSLFDEQKEELSKAFQAKVGVFTGAPGTGKTHTMGVLLKRLSELYGENDLLMTSPTGKASVRLTQAMRRARLALKAQTIHRALGVAGVDDDGNFSFRHGPGNPLPQRFIVMDEASMLDASMCYSFVSSIRDDAHVLFVGDHHQLPPVGRGAVLRDFITSGLPHGDLKSIFRNKGDIVKACKQIREGMPYRPSGNPAFGSNDNCAHIETRSPMDSLENIKGIYNRILASQAIDPLWGIQVLTYMNQGTPIARKELNLQLQGLINPNGASIIRNFRKGDKILCISNTCYHWKNEGDALEKNAYVTNGQMAHIVDFNPKRKSVTVLLEPDGWDEQRVEIAFSDLVEEWELGYAISVHKSQGSAWPICVTMIDEDSRARWMGSRQIIYTALSRAEKYSITIGRLSDINRDCQQNAMSKRRTRLKESLRERIYNDAGIPCWANG